MMKTQSTPATCLIIFMLITISQLNAQPFNLTFSMKGKSGAPDSVFVENLMKGTSLMLKGTDTLRLSIPTALNDLTAQNLKLNVFPNPSTKNSTIEFYHHQRGKVTVTIFDMAGRQLVSQTMTLPPGHVRYILTGLQQGSYILNLLTSRELHSTILLSSNTNAQNHPNLRLLGVNFSSDTQNLRKSQLKSTQKTSDVEVMDFSKDDKLVFKGYFTGAETKTDTITPESDFEFEFGTFYYTLTDYDLNTYLAVEIGNQVWMAENLKVKHFPDGTSIPLATDDEVWKHVKDKNASAVFCYNGNNKDSTKYGLFYSWPAALGNKGVYSNTNPSEIQGVCPAGWHLPSQAEWAELGDFINHDGHFFKQGKALKSTSGWAEEGNGTDDYNFCALPAGQRGYADWSTDHVIYMGDFIGKGNNAVWWTSTYMAVDAAASTRLVHNSNRINYITSMNTNGLSIRCVRDLSAGSQEGN